MKRILCILSLLLIITACDDGNLTVDVIDFSEGPIQKCSIKDVFYKVKGSEMMFFEIPATSFPENQTLLDAPIDIALTTTMKVTYRKYASETSALNICPNAPDATPNLVEQWVATSGIIRITSTAIKSTDATDHHTRITGYTYNVVFKNITFIKPGNIEQPYETFAFGNYTKTITPLAFGFNNEVDKSACVSDNRIFDFSGGEVFTLDVADYNTLFASEVTTTPRTALISATNKLSYRLYSGTITNAYFCATTIPTTPTLTQQWDAIDGILDTSGIIEVTTTTLGAQFQHTIRLKSVTLKKGNSDFSLGDDYLFGTLITN